MKTMKVLERLIKGTITPGALLMLLLLVFLIAWPQPAAAAVSMTVRPGLHGLYKTNQPVSLSVAIENTGPELEGLLEVKPFTDQNQRYQPQVYFQKEFKVPAQARKELGIVISGELASSMPVVELTAGGVVLASSRVEGAAVSGNQVVLALSERMMGSGLQTWLAKDKGFPVTFKYLPPQGLPTEPVGLAVADVILVDTAAVALLSGPQVQALKEWTYLGGRLVLLGGAGAGELGIFSDISPVRSAGERQISGIFNGLRAGGPLKVVAGNLVAGKAVISEKGIPVLARRTLGRGQVCYCGAGPEDLGQEATRLWPLLIEFPSQPESQLYNSLGKMAQRNNWYNLVDASLYIPQLKGPSLWLLLVLWLVYVAAIGPLLYLILRRYDRRDWAWGLVPAGALLAALGFFLLAPLNRLPGQLSQTLAVIEILNPQLAENNAGATVAVARGGDLSLQGTDQMYVFPAYTTGRPQALPVVVHQRANNFQLEFPQVEFGSLRQVAAYGIKRDLGSITGQLSLTGSQLQGELVNNTGLNLRDVKLVLGGRMFELGQFPAKGTVEIDTTLASWKDAIEVNFFAGRYPERPGDPLFLQYRMATSLTRTRPEVMASGVPGIQLLAWCDGSPGVFAVSGPASQTQEYGLVLVQQDLPLNLTPGEVRIPAGVVRPWVESSKGVDFQPEGMEVYAGTGKLTYDLADLVQEHQLKITGLELPATGAILYAIEVHNQQQDKWESLPAEGRKLGPDVVSRYITKDQKFEIRFSRKSNQSELLPYWWGPAVEGVVSQ